VLNAQVLFFSRIFADIVGRFMPRRKALLVRSPAVLAALAGVKVALATAFFLYIRLMPPAWRHDVLALGLVVGLWLLGGYINTSANIMAPSLVEAHLVGRASALLALIFQVCSMRCIETRECCSSWAATGDGCLLATHLVPLLGSCAYMHNCLWQEHSVPSYET
jgi:hypothetical protein